MNAALTYLETSGGTVLPTRRLEGVSISSGQDQTIPDSLYE